MNSASGKINIQDELFVQLMHRISDTFQDHAILKGGMALRLLESPRMTNDLDYTFVPHTSKKEILPELKEMIEKIPGITRKISLHSKALRINIYKGEIAVQIEANVAMECETQPISTGDYARKVNEQGKIIRIMRFDVALAHKLAAWNERRLMRDIYDIYFLYKMAGVLPDMDTLKKRLSKIESRIPELRKMKKMELSVFLAGLQKYMESMTEKQIHEQLSPLMEKSELAGLEIKLRTAVNELINKIQSKE
ncbi:MAG: nucleotidyl transferase AbiEii/AbiGii toxin family protein [Spirochaetales bacterium]|nr:nucleotidyl transferase AbiEii/AbiGii toxin family protein [Spirochaetales bacterium]